VIGPEEGQQVRLAPGDGGQDLGLRGRVGQRPKVHYEQPVGLGAQARAAAGQPGQDGRRRHGVDVDGRQVGRKELGIG
jgi:hypothetical protein